MTIDTKNRLRVAVIATLLGVLFLPMLGAAWNLKVSTSEYALFVAHDSAWKNAQAARDDTRDQMLLDVLCAVKPADRKCR